MDRNLRGAKSQEYTQRGARPIRRGYPDETLMPDNDEFFMTPDFLNRMSNSVSYKINTKLNSNQISALKQFIIDQPVLRYKDEQGRQRPTKYIIDTISNDFINTKLNYEPVEFDSRSFATSELNRQVGDNPAYQRSSVAPSGRADLREKQRNLNAEQNLNDDEAQIKIALGIPDKPQTPQEKILKTNASIYETIAGINKKIFLFNNYTDNGWSQFPQRIVYIPFDSRYRDLDFNQPGKIRFRPTTSPEASNTGGQIYIKTPLQNIIKIVVEAPFYIPTEGVDFSLYERVRMHIDEFRQLGSISPSEVVDGTPYLFDFKAVVQGQKVELFPTNDTIIFRNEFTVAEELTFEFRDPFLPIPFQDDRLEFIVTAGSNPMLITTVGGVPHNVNTGDPIYFNDPVSPNNNYTNDPPNQIIDEIVNNPNGYKATKLNATQLTVPIDLSGLAVNQIQTVFFGSKRIIFRMQFIMNGLAGEN